MSTKSSPIAGSKGIVFQISRFIAKGLGSGWFPKAPGTAGSVLGVIVSWILIKSFPAVELQIVSALALIILAWVTIHIYERGSGSHDDSQVVIDEIAGIFIVYIGLPLTLWQLVVGFVLFRIFDIWKPFPISWADESVPGAFGTLLDDLMAGAISCVLLNLIVYWA